VPYYVETLIFSLSSSLHFSLKLWKLQGKVVYLQTKCFKRTIMEIMNNDFWKKREAAMKRFMAAKERKRQRMAELEALLRQDYIERTGEEPKFVNVW